jgi:hypothetical protein
MYKLPWYLSLSSLEPWLLSLSSRPRFNSTQAFLLVQKLKSAPRAEVLGIKAEAKKKKIFSICPELLIHAELYGLVLAPRL